MWLLVFSCLRYICARFISICLHSLDERDIPSKLEVSTPALLYKV